MKKVRITWPGNEFILRQTFGTSGIWGGYEFTFDEIENADFWIIVNNYKLKMLNCNCPKTNIIYVLQEPQAVSEYNNDNHSFCFLNQFGKILTTQDSISNYNISHQQVGIPWLINKSIDQLLSDHPPEKTKKISIITSNKTYTKGHRKRIECALKIKKYFGEHVDLFGNGFNNFIDKWDVLAPYKFHIAIENSVERNYFSEKITDSILAYSLPLYHGCPNITDYFELPDFLRILNLDSFSEVKNKIKYLLDSESLYENNLGLFNSFRNKIFHTYNFFPMIISVMDKVQQSDCSSLQEISYTQKHSKFNTLQKIITKKIFLNKMKYLYGDYKQNKF